MLPRTAGTLTTDLGRSRLRVGIAGVFTELHSLPHISVHCIGNYRCALTSHNGNRVNVAKWDSGLQRVSE